MMNRRTFLCGLTLGALAAPLAGEGQKAGRVYRVGFLGTFHVPVQSPLWQRFVSVFREAGLFEGQHVVFERRFAEGQIERYPVLAAELASLRLDVIVTSGLPAATAARQAMPAMSIVAVMADLVSTGFAATIARPGGNVTGFSYMTPEVSAKRLELLREAVPRAVRIGVLWNPENVHEPKVMQAVEAGARQLRVPLEPVEARRSSEYEPAFNRLRSQRVDALIVFENFLNSVHRRRIADLALASGLPTIFELSGFVAAGGLIAYGPTPNEWLSVLAAQTVKILRGARAADIPVQQPTKFELVINLKTAKALGLTIPQTLLLRADQVIE